MSRVSANNVLSQHLTMSKFRDSETVRLHVGVHRPHRMQTTHGTPLESASTVAARPFVMSKRPLPQVCQVPFTAISTFRWSSVNAELQTMKSTETVSRPLTSPLLCIAKRRRLPCNAMCRTNGSGMICVSHEFAASLSSCPVHCTRRGSLMHNGNQRIGFTMAKPSLGKQMRPARTCPENPPRESHVCTD